MNPEKKLTVEEVLAKNKLTDDQSYEEMLKWVIDRSEDSIKQINPIIPYSYYLPQGGGYNNIPRSYNVIPTDNEGMIFNPIKPLPAPYKVVDMYTRGGILKSPAYPFIPALVEGSKERNCYYHLAMVPVERDYIEYGER
jgi:hypothetical protein